MAVTKTEEATPAAPELPAGVTLQPGELEALAYRLALQHGEYIVHFERAYKIPREEAIARSRESVWTEEEQKARLETTPPQQVQWHQMDTVAAFEPELVLRKWEQIKQAAREEFALGERACDAMVLSDVWRRAQFLAIRQSMTQEWQPRGGIEQVLIDQMAQCYSGWLEWLRDYHYLHQGEVVRRKGDEEGRYEMPRMTGIQYTDRALATAERFQRMFLRSLRALRDLRRYTGHITINNAGPLSVAGNQQVNVAK